MKFTGKNVIVICVAALAAAVVAGYIIFAGNGGGGNLTCGVGVSEQPLPRDWPAEAPDPRKQTPQNAVEFVKSDEFAQLSAEQQQYYMRSTRKEVMRYQAEKFSSLSAEDRDAFLDEAIDSFEQWQQSRLSPERTSQSPIRTRTEPLTPQQRQQFVDFREALRQRMLQRGIEPGRPKY